MNQRDEWQRLGLTLAPTLITTVVSAVVAIWSSWFAALAIGCGIALVLCFIGGAIVVASARGPLHVAAFAAMASFIVRIGGAGVAAIALAQHPQQTIVFIGLAAGLLVTLLLDLITWARASRRADSTLTPTKESARA